MKRLKISQAKSGQRLDLVVSEWLGITRSQAARAIRSGEVRLNELMVKAGELVKTGDGLSFQPPKQTATKLKIPIIYEDDDIIVVDKPAGLIVHPTGATGNQSSLVDFARAHSSDPDAARPGIVHRLDRDTSGLLIIAKTATAKAFLQRQFAGHKVEKEYLALVSGVLTKPAAEINLPIGAGPGIKRQIDPNGRTAVTKYQRIKQYHHATLVQAWPESGRTHQLRVHFASIGHPIIGDNLYGQAEPLLGRHFLHAHKLAFTAPNGQWVALTSPLPQQLQGYLDSLD